MTENPRDEEMLNETRRLLGELESELVESLGPMEPSKNRFGLPQLFEEWRQVNLRRIVDLGDSAHEMFRQERLVPACTLTRSVFETVGILYYVSKKLMEFTKNSAPDSIHSLLMTAVFGQKDTSGGIPPIQVLTAIDHMDKEISGAREQYEHLCEYAHPNMKGGFGTYLCTEPGSFISAFGKNPQGLDMSTWGLTSLWGILEIGVLLNNRLSAYYPEFVAMIDSYE